MANGWIFRESRWPLERVWSIVSCVKVLMFDVSFTMFGLEDVLESKAEGIAVEVHGLGIVLDYWEKTLYEIVVIAVGKLKRLEIVKETELLLKGVGGGGGACARIVGLRG
jgi:hypothetical protein